MVKGFSRRKSKKRRKHKSGSPRKAGVSWLPGSLPAAFTQTARSAFWSKATRNGMLCTGKDLVVPIPNSLKVNSQDFLFAAIPVNPCYWMGTRIAGVAAMYQNFRPIELIFNFIPQCPVTIAGTVVVGTVWNSQTSPESIQQTLLTSNGGMMCQCYVPFSTRIKLGSNLQQNLFECSGKSGMEHNPFMFLAIMRGSDVVPGYFFVSYKYELKNPLGAAVDYNCQVLEYPDVGIPLANRSIVTLGNIPGFSGPGLMLDVETDESVSYNGSPVVVPSGIPVLVLGNQAKYLTDASLDSMPEDIVVFARDVPVGTSQRNFPGDYAIWYADDTNRQEGAFAPGNLYGWGFKSLIRQGADLLTMWAQNLTPVDNVVYYIYKFERALAVTGALLNVVRGSPSGSASPLLVIKLLSGLLTKGKAVTAPARSALLEDLGADPGTTAPVPPGKLF